MSRQPIGCMMKIQRGRQTEPSLGQNTASHWRTPGSRSTPLYNFRHGGVSEFLQVLIDLVGELCFDEPVWIWLDKYLHLELSATLFHSKRRDYFTSEQRVEIQEIQVNDSPIKTILITSVRFLVIFSWQWTIKCSVKSYLLAQDYKHGRQSQVSKVLCWNKEKPFLPMC